jgi:magnesium chelatase family protein
MYEIAAAGGHNIILIGPPMQENNAAAFATLSHDLAEALETTKIHSVAGKLKEVFNESKTLRVHITISECCISRRR